LPEPPEFPALPTFAALLGVAAVRDAGAAVPVGRRVLLP
jgi:hypothetical protein